MGGMSANPNNNPPADEIWLLAVHPALTADLTTWLHARGLMLGARPPLPIDKPVWMTSPTDEALGLTPPA